MIPTVIFSVIWTCLYFLPSVIGPILLTATTRLAALPVLVGIGLALTLVGGWSEKLPYVFGAPVPPILIFGTFLTVGAEPEGSAFVWTLVGLPLLPYLIGAGTTIWLLEFMKGSDVTKR
jgi:hypothetical protein